MPALAEYIWMDGSSPTQTLRSKSRVINFGSATPKLEDFPEWGFDGSSTNQAVGHSSDCILEPVKFFNDPVRGPGNYLVLCEVLNVDGTAHESNTRAKLRALLAAGGAEHEPWGGFEQEYTLFEDERILGWPEIGYPGPQGPYYCGIGADEVAGRPLIEAHTQACIEAGLMIYGINAEVMLGQWEFQIGYRGNDDDDPGILNAADHTWLGRWLLYRMGEDYGISAALSPKPMKGDWNGSGMHTNFSTVELRSKETGAEAIKSAVARLKAAHDKHIVNYGAGLDERLTGLHETAHISEFTHGTSDRGASIRIPAPVAEKGYGYIEDRRPAANADPYVVANLLVSTVCGIPSDI